MAPGASGGSRRSPSALGIGRIVEQGLPERIGVRAVPRWRTCSLDFHRALRDFRAKNTALIKTMTEDKVSRVRRVLREAGVGTHVEDVTERLREETGTTERHAALVARDQVLKLNGQVTEQRDQDAGLTEYIWRT